MLRTIIETFMPEFEYKDIGRKKFGSCVIWGYVLSIAATIIMVLNGWFIFGYVKPVSYGSKVLDLIRDMAVGTILVVTVLVFCAIHLLLMLISVIRVGLKK